MAWPAHRTGIISGMDTAGRVLLVCARCGPEQPMQQPEQNAATEWLPADGLPPLQHPNSRCSRPNNWSSSPNSRYRSPNRAWRSLCSPSSWRKRAHRREMRPEQPMQQSEHRHGMAFRRWPAANGRISRLCARFRQDVCLAVGAGTHSAPMHSGRRSTRTACTGACSPDSRCSIRTVGAAGRTTGAAARTADAEARTGRAAVFAARADQAGLSHPILTDGINYQQRFGTPARIVRNCGHAAVPTLLQAPHYEFAGVHLGCGAISICGRIAIGR